MTRRNKLSTITSATRIYSLQNCLFTLLELLMTIAIIVILSALLLPSLRKAKETTYKVKCLSSLRQSGLAWMMYYNDNDDRFRAYSNTADTGNWVYAIGDYGGRKTGTSWKANTITTCPKMEFYYDYRYPLFSVNAADEPYCSGIRTMKYWQALMQNNRKLSSWALLKDHNPSAKWFGDLNHSPLHNALFFDGSARSKKGVYILDSIIPYNYNMLYYYK